MKLARLALLVLAFAALAPPAHAQFTWLDDPALTPGDDADRVVLSAAAVAASSTSIAFVTPGARHLQFTYTTANCSSCNHQVQLQAQDPDGTWYVWAAPTAETTNVTERYVLAAAPAAGGLATNLTVVSVMPIPPKWRFVLTRSSGTGTVDITIQAVVW